MPSSKKPKPARQSPARSSIDLQEFAPRRFLIHNPMLKKIIKSEGIINGKLFELTSWRREGLLARLANQGFLVLTLDEQIDQLPTLPPAEPIGPGCPRPLSSRERYSYFDPAALDWATLEPEPPDHASVLLRAGWVVRRRRGRGAPGYYQAIRERTGNAGLVSLDEPAALLAGYAQAAQLSRPPLIVQHSGQTYLLPAVPLPSPHRDLLQRLGEQAKHWQVDPDGWPLARRIYAHLGISLAVVPTSPHA